MVNGRKGEVGAPPPLLLFFCLLSVQLWNLEKTGKETNEDGEAKRFLKWPTNRERRKPCHDGSE